MKKLIFTLLLTCLSLNSYSFNKYRKIKSSQLNGELLTMKTELELKGVDVSTLGLQYVRKNMITVETMTDPLEECDM